MLEAVQIIFFLLWVNLLPPLAHLLFGEHWRGQLDGGHLFIDKKPLLGRHKTTRGVVAALLGGVAVSFLLALPWWLAGLAAFSSMLGDLLSSFIKRRLDKPAGQAFWGLDQLFEGLFPLLVVSSYVPLFWWQFLLILLVFMVVAAAGAIIWSFLGSHPDVKNYPRLVRSSVRFREWRACHNPLPRWHLIFNLTSFLADQILLTFFFKAIGLHARGRVNALDLYLECQEFKLANLPAAFDGFQILVLTDLHLDGQEELTGKLISHLRQLEVDICLLGGDIRMKTYGPIAPSLRHLRCLVPEIRARAGIFGVLGNHDCIEMTPDFEAAGITMLINDPWPILKGGERIWLVGVDDPHYYRTHDVPHAFRDIPADENVIFLAHSPEAYQQAAEHGAALYLCGHTHGGQICLPGSGPILTNSRAPRFTSTGRWQYGMMAGYTSRGVGASGVPLRFNCPAELTLVTLRRGA